MSEQAPSMGDVPESETKQLETARDLLSRATGLLTSYADPARSSGAEDELRELIDDLRRLTARPAESPRK